MDYQQYKSLADKIDTTNNYLQSIETLLAEILLHLKGEPEEEI